MFLNFITFQYYILQCLCLKNTLIDNPINEKEDIQEVRGID